MDLRKPDNEFEVLSKIAKRSPIGDDALLVGIGDDAAVVNFGNQRVAITADALINGVHFDIRYFSILDIAVKSIAVNASDLAAMGATPRYFLVTVATPGEIDVEQLLFELQNQAQRYGAILIGGDLTHGGTFSISVTAIGTYSNGDRILKRSDASAGDTIMVTGPLGGSNLGLRQLQRSLEPSDNAAVLRHLGPQARIAEGRVGAKTNASTAIDISDGLLGDLEHILISSGLGCELDFIPVFAGAELNDALSGGEDYELILTTPDPLELTRAFEAASLTPPISVGRCVATPEVRLLFGKTYQPTGYLHKL